MVGADPSWVDRLSVANPRYAQERLWTALPIDESASAVDELIHVMQYLMKLRPFCETRWGTVGSACQALVGALSVGLDPLFQLVRSKKDVSDYYAHGWANCTDRVRRYACIAAIACQVPEAVMLELMEDDRLVQRVDEIEDRILLELRHVQDYPKDFWQILSFVHRSILQVDEVRSCCLVVANVGAAFITRRVLVVARSAPWSLCYGDIVENVQEVMDEAEEPKEHISNNIWHLGHKGCSANDNNQASARS